MPSHFLDLKKRRPMRQLTLGLGTPLRRTAAIGLDLYQLANAIQANRGGLRGNWAIITLIWRASGPCAKLLPGRQRQVYSLLLDGGLPSSYRIEWITPYHRRPSYFP